MISVIIAGGSGSRLWPLSTPNYPKHLLKINDDEQSLVQHAYSRAQKVGSEVYVMTEISHASHVQGQIGDLGSENFIIEPDRRGTANCIILALAELQEKYSDDEPVAFMHADHYIRDIDGFIHSFRVAESVAKQHERIVLVGVEPDRPATGFGYIHKGELFDEQNYVFSVSGFKEKPEYETAKQYVQSGNYLWNGGYFVATIGAFKNSMKQNSPELFASYQRLTDAGDGRDDCYKSLQSDAIDYALLEKSDNLLVVPSYFDWMDLGSYDDLHKAAGGSVAGNYCSGNVELEGVENSYIHNSEKKPVVVIGLDNVVVVNTPEGIIVSRKDLSQAVGEVSKRLKEE